MGRPRGTQDCRWVASGVRAPQRATLPEGWASHHPAAHQLPRERMTTPGYCCCWCLQQGARAGHGHGTSAGKTVLEASCHLPCPAGQPAPGLYTALAAAGTCPAAHPDMAGAACGAGEPLRQISEDTQAMQANSWRPLTSSSARPGSAAQQCATAAAHAGRPRRAWPPWRQCSSCRASHRCSSPC